MAKGDHRTKVNRASALGLLVLAACAGEATAPPVEPAPVAPATVGSAPAPAEQEVDDLFRWLNERDQTPPRAVIYTIPRVSRESPATDLPTANQAADQENLEVCLDGRFSAFCDHERLSAADAAKVREAERQADLAACTDPELQHLCRAEFRPESPTATSPTDPLP